MTLTLSSFSICRTPVFSVDEEPGNVWHEFKNYIHESSPAFFEVIKNYEYTDLPHADQKIRFTVWKYFNRAKFRATPFGNFAAFSLIPLGEENQAGNIILLKEAIAHRFPNWQEKEHVSLDPKWLSTHACFLRTNTTGYLNGHELRYLAVEDGYFELSAMEVEKTTQATLAFCRTTRSITELHEFLRKTLALDRPLINYFVEQLISAQLLITYFHPNIIGTDYFNRIDFPKIEKKNDYVIAERQRLAGHLSERKLKVLIELTDFLGKHLAVNRNPSFTDFKEKFVKRFENQEVPLLIAMDPEIGIGYSSLTQDKEEDQLIQDLKTYREEFKDPVHRLSYSPLHQFILNQMMQQKTVQLHEFKGSPISTGVPFANTMSILLHHVDNYLIIDSIGGCTANSLLGRFTMASEEITNIGSHFTEIEQEANPGVLFFDIGYQIEKNADNINRRRSIYNYELPILSWTESKHILDPDDIGLSVKNEEIILRSLKYNQRIVPKLASAYNYSRSDLAIYRFLSDLQHQNLHSSLRINIVEIFPGLLHYQRIQYKNMILSAEKWLVPKQVCQEKNPNQALAELHHWLTGIQLDRPFKAGISDQHLLFNPAIKEDMLFFLLFCKNKTDLYIEEAFIPDSCPVNDEYGKPYLSEFIVNMEHTQQIYRPYSLKQVEEPTLPVKGTFLPGEEWLYFEIYCHPSNSNTLLLNIAENYLPQAKKQLKSWFFIRYNDPAYHIRLRLQLVNPSYNGELTTHLSNLLQPLITSGTISDLQLKTYRRETERYGSSRMNVVEQCFSRDSNLILYLISKSQPIYVLYGLSIFLLENICNTLEFTLQEQLAHAERTAERFSKEMKVSTEGLKKINQGYKNYSHYYYTLQVNKIQLKKILQTAKSFLNVLENCPKIEISTLLSDLFHMHVNRLFNNDQRMHEMIIYHYLTRGLKMKIGRLKQEIKPK